MNRTATSSDIDFCESVDSHISKELIEAKIANAEILISELDGLPVGYLRFNYFWDEIPFMNLLWTIEPHRGKGIGKNLVKYWEQQMKERGYSQVMTSTQQDEQAQHFYRKIGYQEIGSFTLEGESPELIFVKML